MGLFVGSKVLGMVPCDEVELVQSQERPKLCNHLLDTYDSGRSKLGLGIAPLALNYKPAT